MNGIIGLGPIADAAGILVIGFTAGIWIRHLFRRSIDGDLINFKEKNKALKKEHEITKTQLNKLHQQQTNLNKLRNALNGSEDELWRLHAANMPSEIASRLAENRPKIVTVMNLKGGVGKTTTVANLAAHFGSSGMRVLTIDLDYQGSLSRMLLLAARRRIFDEPRAIELLSAKLDAISLQRQVISLHPDIENVDLISSGQTFDRFENRLMLRWLIGDEKDDIRYRLARVLVSDPFKVYDLILIDAPPRLSTGAINALSSSHAVLIPTVLDRLSAEAIGNFVTRLNQFRSINTALQYAGVIGTLKGQRGGTDVTEGARKIAGEGVKKWDGTPCVLENEIKYFTDLAREAGSNVGYLRHKDVKTAYTLLADELKQKLHL